MPALSLSGMTRLLSTIVFEDIGLVAFLNDMIHATVFRDSWSCVPFLLDYVKDFGLTFQVFL